jgi:hypothetical protein
MYFTVESGQLRSNSDSAGQEFFISRPFEWAANAEWELLVNLKFNTSSANYIDVYLVSDSSNLMKGQSGYFVRIGNTKDEICLYKTKAGGTPVLLIDGKDNQTNTSNNILKVKVLRNDTGEFQLFTDVGATGNYYREGTATDTMLRQSKNFGILIKQSTASFHKKHFFDNIYAGPLRRDTLPPSLQSWVIENDSLVSLKFNERVFLDSLYDYHFNLLGEGNQVKSVTGLQGKELQVVFSKPFAQLKNYNLKLRGISDSVGNLMTDTILKFKFVMPVTPSVGEVLITEIMADPDPVVGLPNAEYLEIVNRHFLPLQMKGCTFSDPTKTLTFPDLILNPGDWVIICDIINVDSFKTNGKVIGLNGMPALNNAGDDLTLMDPLGRVLNLVSYSDKWYKGDFKKGGGWSLELIDTGGLSCLGSNNWKPSIAFSGGTPGKPNSVLATNPDLKAPKLLSFEIDGDSSIKLQFDEWMDSISVFTQANYISEDLVIDKVKDYDPELHLFKLRIKDPIKRGREVTLTIAGLKDCSGNSSGPDTIRFLLPERHLSGDIVINEILFNPKDDGADYVELYNRSNRILDFSNLKLANRSATSELSNVKKISDTTILFYPSTYLLLTTDIEKVAAQYPVNNKGVFFSMSSLPTMSNEEGNILLLDDSSNVSDSFYYKEKMHFALLNDVEGVSLERIDFKQATNESDNWMSAASSVGYGTPGVQNSQFRSEPLGTDILIIEPPVFSPDGDGYNDFVLIKLNSPNKASSLNINVYDIAGSLVKKMANNELAGEHPVYVWDGMDDNGKKAIIGIYVLYVEIFDLSGNIERIKKAFTLGGAIGN